MANLSKETRELIENNLQNPNVRAFLGMLSDAEGTNSEGYATAFGGSRIDSLASHPNSAKEFTDLSGRQLHTTAAGRYQITAPTWQEYSEHLGLSDFTPENQDRAALGIIAQEGALEDVLNGRFNEAVNKLGNRWASLPSSRYAQPKRDWNFVNESINSRIKAFEEGDVEALDLGSGMKDSRGIPVSQNSTRSVIEDLIKEAGYPDLSDLEPEVSEGMDGTPSWLAQIQESERLPVEESEEEMSSWEVNLLKTAMMDDSNLAHKEALADFFGEERTPDDVLPEQYENLINEISATV